MRVAKETLLSRPRAHLRVGLPGPLVAVAAHLEVGCRTAIPCKAFRQDLRRAQSAPTAAPRGGGAPDRALVPYPTSGWRKGTATL